MVKLIRELCWRIFSRLKHSATFHWEKWFKKDANKDVVWLMHIALVCSDIWELWKLCNGFRRCSYYRILLIHMHLLKFTAFINALVDGSMQLIPSLIFKGQLSFFLVLTKTSISFCKANLYSFLSYPMLPSN